MRVHDDRLAMTARYLEAEALDGLVAVNFGQNSFLESHAVFVLSGVRPIGESAVVVDRDGGSASLRTKLHQRLLSRQNSMSEPL